MTLRDQQLALLRSVRFDPAPADALAHFTGDDRLDAAARLTIYRRMYWFRQISALGEVFPLLRGALGGEAFARLATRYIRRYPSEHHAIEWLGRSLPAMVAETLPSHRDLCALEWARNVAQLALDPAATLGPADVDPQRFADGVLHPVPGLQLLWVGAAALAAHGLESGADADGPGPFPVVVWRQRFAGQVLPVTGREADALRRALAGEPMAEVLDVFAADEVAQAFEMFRAWLSRGWVQEIRYDVD